jgi:hypothetical protein
MNLSGDSTMRGVLLSREIACVQDLLPRGLKLGKQTLTGSGTHPVMLFFNDVFRGHLSIPTLIPNLTYHEFHIGIPFTYLAGNGPYYYMARLYLDQLLPVLGGLVFWGLPKEMASIAVSANPVEYTYTVTSLAGYPLASLRWQNAAPVQIAMDAPFFIPIREILSQTLISRLPAAVGPVYILSDFDKLWKAPGARVLALGTRLHLDGELVIPSPVPGPVPDWMPGLAPDSPSGAFELRVPWRLSLPYPPQSRSSIFAQSWYS